MKYSQYRFYIYLLTIITLSCSTVEKSPTGIPLKPIYDDAETSKIIVPFFPIVYRAPYHLISFFDGDPDYESAEGFVFDKLLPDGNPAIRVIMTYHNKTQEDYFNFDISSDGVRENRPTFRTDISWTTAINGRDYQLLFKLKDSRELSIVFLSDTPLSSRWGGLTDIEGHSPEGGLPLFFREASGIALKQSYVRIQNKHFPISINKQISFPPFFTGYKAYVSKGFNSFILPTFTIQEPLETFLLKGNNYKINSVVTQQNIILDPTSPYKEISEIRCSSPELSPGHFSSIKFSPSFPNLALLKVGSKAEVQFIFSFNSEKEVSVSGNMMIEKTGPEAAVIISNPTKPDWARNSRKMKYTVTWDENTVNIKSEMN